MTRFLQILTIVFLVLTVITVVIFFAFPEQKKLIYLIGGTAIGVRLIYYFIRFVTKA